MKDNYLNRIRAAAWASGIIHLLLAVLAWWYRPAFTFGPMPVSGSAVTVSLAPRPETAEEQDPRRFIESATPATMPVKPTDLIAVQNSNASDTTMHQGETLGPKPDVLSESEALGGKKGAAPVPAQPETGENAPAPPSPEEKSPAVAERPAEDQLPTTKAAPETAEMQDKTLPKPEKGAEKPVAPRTQVADAGASMPSTNTASPAPAVDGPPGNNREEDAPTRGAANNGVRKLGVLGFEAMQSEIAPYLKNVQDAVEKRWRETLLTKYNGSNATHAEIDCEIGADGRIVSLTVAGTPDDRIYAALCKEAIEKAGPFGPFPFVVPDMYRNRNLEIRWSFNFL